MEDRVLFQRGVSFRGIRIYFNLLQILLQYYCQKFTRTVKLKMIKSEENKHDDYATIRNN